LKQLLTSDLAKTTDTNQLDAVLDLIDVVRRQNGDRFTPPPKVRLPPIR
jgi:hypothetical protein